MIELSTEQAAAVEQITRWYRDEPGRQELTLGGFAGTGKSTLAKYIMEAGIGTCAAIAPTGKAARVLRKKGILGAQTIHSFLYNYLGKNDAGHLLFAPKEETERPGLLISDESSMVPLGIYRDLQNTGLRILWIGDHGQLEPVGEDAQLMRDPAIKLETIHRQAAESPILTFAHAVRTGQSMLAQESTALSVDRVRGVNRGLADVKWLTSFDQILVAFNKTRIFLNMQIRQALGFKGVLNVGEKLICRKNDRRKGLFNGMLLTCERIREAWPGSITCDLRTDDDNLIEDVDVATAQFNRNDVVDAAPGTVLVDYGHAITVHKSQGSEWSNVLVIEEPCSKWSMQRWRYTAATRAAERLTYLTDDLERPQRAVNGSLGF